jgi:nucleotide-binding universal stress UspA family protein
MKDIAQKNKLTAETMFVEIADIEKKISEKIVESALSVKADLLVMGTHGRRGFKRFILGSVAEETMRISPIPVLLVRGQEES